MRSFAVFALLALLTLPAAGLEPYLVKDINPVPGPADSNPALLVSIGDAVLFFADDGLAGRELWRSDGTAAGTWQLTGSGLIGIGDAFPYAVTERLAFFHGQLDTLWVSDGTPAGTFPVTGFPVRILPWRVWMPGQGVLYFAVQDPEHGSELWRSDGTPAGTYLVADVRPGPAGSGVQWLTAYRGRVWFGADDGQRGGSLWSSDGTAAGTVLAVDPVPSSASHEPPDHIQAAGKRLTFFARPPASPRRSRQLWAGDGTRKGTAPVTALSGGKGSSSLYDSVAQGNRLFFVAEDRKGQELWVSDGTARGTRVLTSLPKRDAFFSVFNHLLPRQEGLPGRFVFLADDGPHGVEPWVSDGTPQGTRLLRDVCPGVCSSFGGPLAVLAGRLYFSAQDPSHATELWSTDGTEAGTRRVSDICPGTCSSFPHSPFILGNRLLFTARDPTGREIWSTDGSEQGTVRITDFQDPFLWEDEGFHGAIANGQLLFNARDGGLSGMELWRTDGTVAGTWLVEDINRTDTGGSFPMSLRPLGDEVVFAAHGGEGLELWRSDGTEAGTLRFRTFGPEEQDAKRPAGAYAEAGGLLFYFANAIGDPRLPWRTDGTAAGTFPLTDAGAPGCCSRQEMEALGNLVLFDLKDEEHGLEPWVSDGTPAGTRLLLDVMPGPVDSQPRYLTAFQGNVYFAAIAPAIGPELWRSDGTAAGTVPLDLYPGGIGSNPNFLTVHAGRLWFFADDERGRELWSSDGTLAGTRLEVEFVPGRDFLTPVFMASLGDRLVISTYGQGLWATDGTGTEKIHDRDFEPGSHPQVVFQGRLYYASPASGRIWVTDGTEAGTGPLLDREGAQIYSPSRFAILGDRLVFIAPGLGNLTLWESDGTPAGTFPVQPRVRINSLEELVSAGDRVFFPSYDPSTGWELWAVRP